MHTMLVPILLSGLFLVSADQSKPKQFVHVATTGNDQAQGTKDKPVATLQRAVELAKTKTNQGNPVDVLIQPGRYELNQSLVFTVEQSGQEQAPLRFLRDGDQPVILSGGSLIKNWKPNEKGLWSAQVDPKIPLPLSVRHISVNGQMRLPPRLPKKGTYTIKSLAGADPKVKYNTPANKFEFHPGEIQSTWKNIQDIDIVVLHFWVDGHYKMTSIDGEKNTVQLDRSSRRRFTETHAPNPGRYYISNVLEALSEAGEFYLDRSTRILHYKPFPNEDMTKAEVMLPQLATLMQIQGEPTKNQFVQHIIFEGLTFQDSVWTPKETDAVDAQAASTVPGAIIAKGAKHCRWSNCLFRNLGSYALELQDGCRENQITHNEITSIGAGGIKLSGGVAGTAESLRTGSNTITDNHLHHLGELFHSGIGILAQHTDQNIIAYNHIHHLYYTGISVGWIWGYAPSVSKENRIEYNHIHDVGQKLLSDMGGIYMLGTSPGTVVRGNIIHDIDSFNYGGWGIYTDEGSTGILIEKNLVYRTKSGGFHQHYGKENIVRNNIFALAREEQIARSRMEPHISFTFEKNIVYFKQGPLLGKNWKDDKFILDSNVYFQAENKPIVFPGNLDLKGWQARGFDPHSIIADPRFENPEKDDFRLKSNSPALQLGFEAFEYKAGPRPKTDK